MVSKETDAAEHLYQEEKEAKLELIRAMLSYNWNSCEQSKKKKKYSINRQSPLLELPFFAADPIKNTEIICGVQFPGASCTNEAGDSFNHERKNLQSSSADETS